MSPPPPTPAREAPSGDSVADVRAMNAPSSKLLAASSAILTAVTFPDATSMMNRRNGPLGFGILQRIRFPSGNHSTPSHSVSVSMSHCSGSHGNENRVAGPLPRDGEHRLPVGRQACAVVAFAQTQWRRAVRRPEDKSWRSYRRTAQQSASRGRRACCASRGKTRAPDPVEGERPRTPTCTSHRASSRRPSGAMSSRRNCPGPRTTSLCFPGKAHGKERRTGIPNLLLRGKPDLAAVRGPGEPRGRKPALGQNAWGTVGNSNGRHHRSRIPPARGRRSRFRPGKSERH